MFILNMCIECRITEIRFFTNFADKSSLVTIFPGTAYTFWSFLLLIFLFLELLELLGFVGHGDMDGGGLRSDYIIKVGNVDLDLIFI